MSRMNLAEKVSKAKKIELNEYYDRLCEMLVNSTYMHDSALISVHSVEERIAIAAHFVQMVEENPEWVIRLGEFVRTEGDVYFVGTGENYFTAGFAKECLKSLGKENVYAMNPDQFMDEPLMAKKQGINLVLFDFDSHNRLKSEHCLLGALDLGGKALWVTNRTEFHVSDKWQYIFIKFHDDELSPLVCSALVRTAFGFRR